MAKYDISLRGLANSSGEDIAHLWRKAIPLVIYLWVNHNPTLIIDCKYYTSILSQMPFLRITSHTIISFVKDNISIDQNRQIAYYFNYTYKQLLITINNPTILYIFHTMKSILLVLALIAVIGQSVSTQEIKSQTVYTPFTQQELNQVTIQTQSEKFPEQNHQKSNTKKHHDRPRHPKHGEDQRPVPFDEEFQTNQDQEYGQDLTDQEKEERRRERKRYNHIFKIGMIAGTAVLAVIIFKFCRAKRQRRCRQMQNIRNQIQPQQPYIYNPNPVVVNPNAYPQQPYVQMGRPYPQPQPVQPIIRGRVHDSYIRPRQVENPVEAQIKFHQNEILRLKQMKKQERQQECELQRFPINTTESFESQHPMNKYRGVPVGQPIYPKDANSSFASEYPEI